MSSAEADLESDSSLCEATLLPALRRLATGTDQRRKFLVLVNPFSGKKRGRSIYDSTVLPMLAHSNIEPTLIVTERAGHASDLFSAGHADSLPNPYAYDGCIAVGGDGLLYEALQGEATRRHSPLFDVWLFLTPTLAPLVFVEGIMTRPDSSRLLESLPFGIIPAGSGNGLAASVCHGRSEADGPLQNIFIICKFTPSPSDLSTYTTSASNKYLSFLSLSWGIVADVDLESDVFRALGSLRFDVYAVWRMISLRKYRARLSYLPEGVDSGAETDDDPTKPVPDGWVTIEDTFQCFWALQTSHASQGMHTSPGSTMDDGLFHITCVRGKVSRVNLLSSFLAFEDGSHVKQEHVEVIRCRAFRLEPLSDNSHVDLDGEEVEYGAIQARVMRSAWRVFY